MDKKPISRRTYLASTVALGGVGLAGCSEGQGGVDRDAPPEEQVDQHLVDVNGYDGTIVDMTDESEITILNGDRGTDYKFDPAAVRISAGTTVTWEWIGSARHTVTSAYSQAFESGIKSGAGSTFTHDFAERGLFLYLCEPHSTFQRGAVLVE